MTILQLLAPAAGLFLFQAALTYVSASIGVWAYIALVLMIMIGALVYAWLYFAQFALIFDGKHSWHALLFSRDLMRKRFFKVATRIVVFLAVWSGFKLVGRGSVCGGELVVRAGRGRDGFSGAATFLVDLAQISVNFATTAFLVAAGLRLYQDLREPQPAARVDSASQSAMQPTAQLPSAAL